MMLGAKVAAGVILAVVLISALICYTACVVASRCNDGD